MAYKEKGNFDSNEKYLVFILMALKLDQIIQSVGFIFINYFHYFHFKVSIQYDFTINVLI